MHDSVLTFVEECLEANPILGWEGKENIIEVGSRNVNGSVRHLFPQLNYIGIDNVDGEGVDLVSNAHDLTELFDLNTIDIVVCTEMLEHDRYPWITLNEIVSVLKPKGWLILTTRAFDEKGCYPMHDDPHGDFWRFTKNGLMWVLSSLGFRLAIIKDDPEATGVFSLAQKIGLVF
jgi:SAM-dependent methyltransferase